MKVKVKVKTNAKNQKIEEVSRNSFIIWVKSVPIENKANNELRKILAKYFKVPKSCVEIKLGENYKEKVFEIML